MATNETGEKGVNPSSVLKHKAKFRLSLKQKNWVLSFHIGFAALWTGTVLSMFLITFRNQSTNSPDSLLALNEVVNLLDNVVVIPAAIGSVVTATVLCWQTNYGFFKFYWVIIKWILTTGLILFGTFWLFPWSNRAEAIASLEGVSAFQNPIYQFDVKGVLIGSMVQILFLLVIIAISGLKPWGRRLGKPKISDIA